MRSSCDSCTKPCNVTHPGESGGVEGDFCCECSGSNCDCEAELDASDRAEILEARVIALQGTEMVLRARIEELQARLDGLERSAAREVAAAYHSGHAAGRRVGDGEGYVRALIDVAHERVESSPLYIAGTAAMAEENR